MACEFETKCVHGSFDPIYSDAVRSVSFPIYQTATFSHVEIGHTQFN